MVTQSDYVMELMKNNNGYLTLREIYEKVKEDKDSPFKDVNSYKSNIRSFIQREENRYFRIKPGLWALVDYERKLPEDIKKAIKETNVSYYDRPTTHAQMQANIIYMGKELNFQTYIYRQDNKRTFDKGKRLIDIVDTNTLPDFTYKEVLKKIKTIDVMWFEEMLIIEDTYKYPKAIFEVEESSDFVKSLDKFKLLKMFNLQYMYIVAPEGREETFKKVIDRVDYEEIRTRVIFLQYEDIESLLENPKLLFRYRLI